MNDAFSIAAIAVLTNDEFLRVLRNCGVTESDAKTFQGSMLWSRDRRAHMRRTLDAYIHGTVDMVGLPRVEIAAEIAAAIIAATVNPINWPIAAAWQHGLKHAADMMSHDEETVQIERCSPHRLYTLIVQAASAIHNMDNYDDLRSKIQSHAARQETMTNA